MITCPWCGTSYAEFRSNCQNCGGPLPVTAQKTAPGLDAGLPEDVLPVPPPPPRPIANRYTWRLMASDSWAIPALVFSILGAIFTLLGVVLTLAVVTAFVGIPFAILGILFLAGAAAVGVWRYQEMKKIVEVLRAGDAAEGQITQVVENLSVQVNGRHPWVIRYQFHAGGQPYQGQVSTLKSLGTALQAGKRACVLYLPHAPDRNVLYPHP